MKQPHLNKTSLLTRVTERIDARSLGDDLQLTFRVRGGMPSERRDDEITVLGAGRIRARLSDRISDRHHQLDEAVEPARILRIAAGLNAILRIAVPRERIAFQPDELVGSVEVRFEGKSSKLYFHPDDKRLPVPEALTVDRVVTLADSLTQLTGPVVLEERQ